LDLEKLGRRPGGSKEEDAAEHLVPFGAEDASPTRGSRTYCVETVQPVMQPETNE
jgi:hypothetical protein